jgi:hypothetical protein
LSVVENYGRLPLGFEANTGQTDKSVRFLSRGGGYALFLTDHEAVLALRSGSQKLKALGHLQAATEDGRRANDKGSRTNDVFRMKLVGANRDVAVTGLDQLPGKSNYFIGNDPSKWRTNIPTYTKVRYTGIYPGIDLVYYGNPSVEGQLEFDFAVAPKADPGLIRFAVATISSSPTGGQRPQIAANGDLVVTIANGTLAFHKPLVYQTVDGGRQPVAGDFALLGKHTVGFRLGSYDRAKALMIDPVLAYSTFLGGSGVYDAGNAIAVDTAGNVYVTGQTSSTDFPVTPGAFQTTNHAAANSNSNAFVTKLNATGSALVYSTYLGGSGISAQLSASSDAGNAIAVDNAGNVYVTGQTYSADFPVTPGAFQTTNPAVVNGTSNAFISRLNATGTALVYSTYLGGSGISLGIPYYSGDQGNAIALDAAGNVYVAGQAASTDFPVTPGAIQTTNHGAANDCTNAFITKLNPTGTALVYSTFLGGSGHRVGLEGDGGNAIAVGAAGDAYVAGWTSSADFPVTPGAFQTSGSGGAFIAELNPTGTALVYSTYLGGGAAKALALDAAGNVYVAGSGFPVTPGAFQTTGGGASIAKLNPTGTALVYSTYLGGSGGFISPGGSGCVMPAILLSAGDAASALAIDSSGNAYATGSTASHDFPVTQDAYQTTNHAQPPCPGGCTAGLNAFVTELNSTGSALVYSTYLGGRRINAGGLAGFEQGDQARALALDSSGNLYVTGSRVSYDFPVTAGALQTMSGGAFVAKLNMSATSTATTPTVTVTPTSPTITSWAPLTVTISVSGGSGDPTPTGTVTLEAISASGVYSSADTTLNSGSATIDIPAGSLPASPTPCLQPDVLIAKYVPDTASSSTYNFSSGVGSVTVVPVSISVTPSSSALTWAQSQSQALPVAIVATGGTGDPVPTGTVTLTTGSWSSAATALSVGSATISIPPGTLTAGSNVLNVSYSGDSNYAAETLAGSAVVTVGTPNGVFTIAGTPVTLTAGAATGNTSIITVTPSGGFAGSVALTATVTSGPSGAQDPPTLSFGSTSPVSITGTAAGTAALAISTTAPGVCSQVYQMPGGILWYMWGGAALAWVLLFGMQARRRRWQTTLATLALLVALTGGLLACGGGGDSPPCAATPGTTPGIYTITVTGTSGATTTTGTVTLTVQ